MKAYKYPGGPLEISEIIEGGGWVIRFLGNGKVNLFEIPQFGGEEIFEGEFDNVYKALDICTKWT